MNPNMENMAGLPNTDDIDPNADRVRYLCIGWSNLCRWANLCQHYDKTADHNLKLTFDRKTGALKAAEAIPYE